LAGAPECCGRWTKKSPAQRPGNFISIGSGSGRLREQPAVTGDAHHRLLQLVEGADLDLADAFAADAVDLAQLLERLGIVGRGGARPGYGARDR
jgi:hypothetical protein